MKNKSGITAALLALAALGTASYAAPAKHLKGRHMAASDTLKSCEPKSATLHLAEEGLLTRTALTTESIERFAPAVTLGNGDPRLVTLGEAFRGLPLEPAKLPQFEMRLLVKFTCADGKSHVLTGSKTLDDGRIELSLDGENASTRAPLRRELEALAR